MSTSDRPTFRALWCAFIVSLRANAGLAVTTVVLLTIGNLALDHFATTNTATLVGSVVNFMAQVMVTRVALQRIESASLPSRIGGFFLLNLLVTLAVLAGLILLVLPGAYLAARWLLAGPILLRDGNGASDAMRRSWSMTAGAAWPLTGLLLLLWMPAGMLAMGGAVMAASIIQTEAAQDLAMSFVMYLAMLSASVASWLTAVAAFDLLRPPSSDALGDVFA